MTQEYEDDFDDGHCGQCDGEGFTFACIDGFCEDAEVGCDMCTRRCDWCNPRKPSKDTAALQQVLADALAKAGVK